jgi:hypothetical protein
MMGTTLPDPTARLPVPALCRFAAMGFDPERSTTERVTEPGVGGPCGVPRIMRRVAALCPVRYAGAP